MSTFVMKSSFKNTLAIGVIYSLSTFCTSHYQPENPWPTYLNYSLPGTMRELNYNNSYYIISFTQLTGGFFAVYGSM